MLIPTASKIIVNATALVHAFANGMNAFDIPKLQGLLAPGAQYELLPHSLGRPVMPAYDGLAMLAFLKQIVPDFKAEIKDIDESKDGSKVWAYATGNGTAIDGRAYVNEYVFMFDIVRYAATGLKISGMREFCDSAFLAGFESGAGAGSATALAAK